MSNAFKSNPSLANNKTFAATNSKLDLLMNNTEIISERFKANTENYQLGVFMTDKSFISSVSNITGNYETGLATAMGVDFGMSFLNIIEENEKFKKDYKNLAGISKNILYSEIDNNLNKALIDASLGIEHHIMLTPLYRYDFKQGTSLLVENGVLKFVNPKTNTKIDLTRVEKRHDLNYYKRGAHGAKIDEPSLYIYPNDSLFYIYTGKNIRSDVNCNCLTNKDGFVINAFTGEIKVRINGVLTPDNRDVRNMRVKGDTLIVTKFMNEMGRFNIYETGLYKKDESSTYHLYPYYKLDKNKDFLINHKPQSFKSLVCHTASKSKNHYCFERDDIKISLFWGETSRYEYDNANDKRAAKHHSSLLQTSSHEKTINTEAMTNELTGIAMKKNGDLFFTGKGGTIGKLNASEYSLNDPFISNKIRNSLVNKGLKIYDYDLEKKFTSEHGRVFYTDVSIFPSLQLSPDEKWLIYTVNEKLYIISTEDFNNMKEYTLTYEPNHFFFAKEKGRYTIYLQGENEFRFPITKKYDLNTLTEIDTRKKPEASVKNSKQTENSTEKSKSTGSISEEIKELKKLLDEGVITNEEFVAAKKKLLNNDQTGKATTNNKKPNTKPDDGIDINRNEPKTKKTENPYSNWMKIVSDKALQVRYQLLSEQGNVSYYRVQFRINFEDGVMCKSDDCDGYLLAFGYTDDVKKEKYTFKHFKFHKTFTGIYTMNDSIPVVNSFPDGSKVFLKKESFYYTTKNNPTPQLDRGYIFQTCVDDILKSNPDKHRCAGKTGTKDLYKKEEAEDIWK